MEQSRTELTERSTEVVRVRLERPIQTGMLLALGAAVVMAIPVGALTVVALNLVAVGLSG